MAAVQTRSGKLRIARDLIEMAARATDDEDYKKLIRKIESGTNFEKLPQEDPHRCYAEVTLFTQIIYLCPPSQKGKT